MTPMPSRATSPRPLEVWPCQSICAWSQTGERWVDDTACGPPLLVFGCEGCGSEWVRTQAWTPIDVHGVVPVAVQFEQAVTLG